MPGLGYTLVKIRGKAVCCEESLWTKEERTMESKAILQNEAKSFSVLDMVLIALVTAVTCVLSPISIPIGPVPISLGTMAIMMDAYILGWKKGTIAYIVYLLLGIAGLPVFSGFGSGLGKVAGPTGGYLVGYFFIILICGLVSEHVQADGLFGRGIHLAGMIVGAVVLYAFGTAWFCISAGTGVAAALTLCVFPFLVGDLIKMLLVLSVAPPLCRQIKRIQNR